MFSLHIHQALGHPGCPRWPFLVPFLVSGACGQGTQAKESEQTPWLFQAVPGCSMPQPAVDLTRGVPMQQALPSIHTHSWDLSQRLEEVRAATPQQRRDLSWLCWGHSQGRENNHHGSLLLGPRAFTQFIFTGKTSRAQNASLPVPALEEDHRREERQPRRPTASAFELMLSQKVTSLSPLLRQVLAAVTPSLLQPSA